jgi:hypothetical protein
LHRRIKLSDVRPKRIQALLGNASFKIAMDVCGHLRDEADTEAAAPHRAGDFW